MMKLLQTFTAIYMITFGVIGLLWPFISGESELYDSVFDSYGRELFILAGFVVAGFGLLKSQLWARKLALVALGLAFFYGGNLIAFSWAGGKPVGQHYLYSYLASFVLFGLCFLAVYFQPRAQFKGL